MKSTKELARDMGLLRKRSNKSKEVLNRIHKTTQIYSYLIVLDFESTCWKGVKNKPQEIIEFPAVLLNARTGNIESEFQYYVMPTENPILSEFCTELTGITQEQVDEGIPLSICLSKFRQWLNKQKNDKNLSFSTTPGDSNKLCTFVTWSDWDLNVCLQYECRRKQLRKPTEMDSWIDLRLTYRNFYQRRPQGLNGALQDLGIAFEGREHSGLHDSRNTAHLAWRMMSDGCVLQNTKSLNVKPKSNANSTYNTPFDNKKTFGLPLTTNKNTDGIEVYRDSEEQIARDKPDEVISSESYISRQSGLREISVNCHKDNFKTPSSISVGFKRAKEQNTNTVGKKQCFGLANQSVIKISSGSSKKSSLLTGSLGVFKTPASCIQNTEMKRTPPMCGCGRRAKRLMVQNPGPNQGRFFFACPNGKKEANGTRRSGCGFFKWEESNLGTSPKLPQGQGHSVASGQIFKKPFVNSCSLPQPNFDTPNSVARVAVKKTLGVKR